ncbi:hypothetical protein CDD83_8238 [Cordyceps sp. RAO-2017]|nr:hypothetical protein CDD83_8238 [Cordyceps sp. RAO-2017]
MHNAATSLFLTCLLAVMGSTAGQVGLARAAALTPGERRRRRRRQALVMFPLPLLQLAWTWPAAARRYEVGALVGCVWAAYPAWPNLVFFVLPPVVISLATSAYAVLTYFRFRQIAKTTESALSSDRRASRRSQRTKRRLYMMVTSILVPYLPLVIAVAVGNVLERPPREPYSFDAVHHRAAPLPWHVVLFSPSSEIGWASLNNCYVNVLVALPIFLFFGTTTDAVNEYRAAALFLRLGRLFPGLETEYDPDRTTSSAGATSVGSGRTANTSGGFSIPSFKRLSPGSPQLPGGGPNVRTVEFAPTSAADPERGAADPARRRNPFLFRTRLNLPHLFGTPSLFRPPPPLPGPPSLLRPPPPLPAPPVHAPPHEPQWGLRPAPARPDDDDDDDDGADQPSPAIPHPAYLRTADLEAVTGRRPGPASGALPSNFSC